MRSTPTSDNNSKQMPIMERDGIAHKIISVFLRMGEFACAIIVLGLLSRFVYVIDAANASIDGRIIYTMVTAGIATVFTMCMCPPFDVLFLSFPFDFVLFIMWLVAFCLLETVCLISGPLQSCKGIELNISGQRTGINTCSSSWYYNYWGYYWGGFWRTAPIGTVGINGAGCSQWRTVLAFSFIALSLHILSGILVSVHRIPQFQEHIT